MKRIMMAIGLACSLAIAACAPLKTGIDPVKATAAIDKVESRYVMVKAFTEMLMPYLPAEHQARIRLVQSVIDRALVAARIATTAAEQVAALKQAETAIDTLTEDVPPAALASVSG